MDAGIVYWNMPSQSKSGREEKQYNYRLISSCVLPVLDECPPRFVAKGAEIDFIFRGTFLSVSEQKQHTLKEYPYENGEI